MKLLLISLLFLVVFQTTLKAQTAPDVSIDFAAGTVVIGNVAFNQTSTLEAYQKVLGKPDRVEKVGGVEKIYAYDQLGIALSLKKNAQTVEEIYITYLYDGDKKVAKQAYSGKLIMNGKEISIQLSPSELGKMTGISFTEAMTGLYMTRNQGLNVVVYYPENGKKALGQVAISFASVK